MAQAARDYVYPNIAEFNKGERIRHSFYGEGQVLEVVRFAESDIIVVELDDKSKNPLGVGPGSRPDFRLWEGRKDILRLKYVSASGAVGVKPVKTVVGVKPVDEPVGVKPVDE